MSGQTVGVEDRRAFLAWFGSNHEMKQPSALDVLRFLLSAEDRLTRLRIIDDASYLRPLLVVAVRGRRQPGLLYQTLLGSSTDPAAIISDLALTRGPVYLAPYLPPSRQGRYFERAREKGLRTAVEIFAAPADDAAEEDRFLAELALPAKRTELAFLIDQALERRDREAFLVLVAVRKKLEGRRNLAIVARS